VAVREGWLKRQDEDGMGRLFCKSSGAADLGCEYVGRGALRGYTASKGCCFASNA
jgi:hypothetical protein